MPSGHNYITYTIESWMSEEYGLKGNELLLFAIVYNFSKFGGQNAWYGSLSMIEKITGMTKRTATNTYKSLEEKGLIKKDEVFINNIKTCRYTAIINESENEGIKKSRNGGGMAAYISTNDNDCITQSNTSYQEPNQTEDEYYNSLADCVTNSEESEPVQETLFGSPEEPKKKKTTKKPTHPNEINEILACLNSKANRRFTDGNEKTVKQLEKWLNKGFEVESIKRMISYKCNEWLGNKKMEGCLKPSVLFGNAHFEDYIEESQDYQDFVSNAERGCINV